MNRMIPIALLALGLIAGGGWWLSQSSSHGAGAVAQLPGAANAQTSSDEAAIVIDDMVLGDATAPVTVIEYASYTCPHCATFHAGPYKDLKKAYIDTGKVKFIFREVYFDKYGMWASMVARCGGGEKFFGITDLIFKSQGDWARAGSDAAIADELRKIGRLSGLDGDTLQACLSDGDKLRALVAWYQQNAETDDVSSTPTLIVNGTKHGNMNFEDLSALIEAEL